MIIFPIFLSTEAINHEFSSPWQNSDLVLIIEDQKIHVNRLILQMTSPVLSNFVTETDSNEVPLSRTTVSEFVDLLRVIYPQFKNQVTRKGTSFSSPLLSSLLIYCFLFVSLQFSLYLIYVLPFNSFLSVDNIEHVYRLAEEYQIESVMESL